MRVRAAAVRVSPPWRDLRQLCKSADVTGWGVGTLERLREPRAARALHGLARAREGHNVGTALPVPVLSGTPALRVLPTGPAAPLPSGGRPLPGCVLRGAVAAPTPQGREEAEGRGASQTTFPMTFPPPAGPPGVSPSPAQRSAPQLPDRSGKGSGGHPSPRPAIRRAGGSPAPTASTGTTPPRSGEPAARPPAPSAAHTGRRRRQEVSPPSPLGTHLPRELLQRLRR